MSQGISIIIPTLNGGEIFYECLDAIGKQSYGDPVQLIVVDSGSTDGTVACAEKAGALVQRIAPNDFHHARTRNQAISLAAFDRVIFMVQDAVPCSERWLEEMAHALKAPEVAAAFAAQIPHVNATPYARFETESIASARVDAPVIKEIYSLEFFQKISYDMAYRSVGLDNVCAIYRKEVLEKTPFPEVEFAEDLAWALKICLSGHRTLYLPHIRVRHSHNRSPDYGFRRQIVNSYWLARIMGRVREDVSFLSLRDLAFLTWSLRALVFKKINEKPEGIAGYQPENLFINHLWKRHPFKVRVEVGWFDPFFFECPRAVSQETQKMVQQVKADILYQFKLIEEQYSVHDWKERFELLEQVAANTLGRVYGEVYAGCMLKRVSSKPLESFIKPFLSDV